MLAAGMPLMGAQRPGVPEVTLGGGFQMPIQEGNQRVALITGREARPALLAGRFEVTGFKLETYRNTPGRNPETELIVESPFGVFDPKGATSPRSLSLRSSDGRFAVTGEGWSWEQASGLLVVSNQVRTTLRRPGAPTHQPPVEVTARRLEYNLKTGETLFQDECRAEEPGRARLRAGALRSRLVPRAERPETIAGTNDVVIEILRPGREGRATGQGARYEITPDGEQITLVGQPAWEFGPGAGSAEELILYPGRESYTARGSARMRLRDPGSNRPMDAPARSPEPEDALEVRASVIDSKPGLVVFEGPVAAALGKRLELEAERVEAAFAPGAVAGRESLHLLTATGGVRARLPMGGSPLELNGQRMVYSLGEHAMIDVTGEPTWRLPHYAGRAERFVIHPEVPTFQALDAVRVTWTPPGPGSPGPASTIELQSARMIAEGGEARFGGGVKVTRPGWEMQAGEIDLRLATNAALREIAARGEVRIDFLARPPGASTNRPPAPTAGILGGLLREASEAARRWKVQANQLNARFAAGATDPTELDAEGEVRISHAALQATGGRLTYQAAEGPFRLRQEPRLNTADGLEIIGGPATALLMDPTTGRFGVEGAPRRMVMPSAAAGRSAAPRARPTP